MANSALIRALEAAQGLSEKHLSSLANWMVFWTAVVVFGLIVEYRESAINFIKEKPWRRLTFIEQAMGAAKQPFLPKLAVLIAPIMVAGGVAGELAVTYIASHEETRSRFFADHLQT